MPIPTPVRQLATRLRRRPGRRTTVVAVTVLVAVVGSGAWVLSRPDATSARTTTTEVTSGTFRETVTGSGTVEPARQADLAFDVSGRVTSVEVEAGDTVRKGQVLATLDTATLDASLAAAEAQLSAARSTASSDGASSSTQRAANDASVASAEADLAQAEDDLAAATLRSTIAGTVAAVDVEVGDQAGSSTGGGGADSAQGADTGDAATAAVTVVSPQEFVVDAAVAADDVARVEEGLQVTITPNGATEPVYGTVSSVGRVAETSASGTATFPVTVAVTGEQDGLYAGTSADVVITVKQRQDVVSVSTLAVRTDGDETYVVRVDGTATERVPVEVGEVNGMSTEILSGVEVGDVVQVTTPSAVRQGGGSGGQRGDQMMIPGGAPPGGATGGGMPSFEMRGP